MFFFELELPGRTVTFPFGDGTRALNGGAHPDNDIVLPFRGISRFHFTLARTGERWGLTDLQSRNGTHVNGKRVPESPLKSGDRVAVGVVELTVRESAAEREDFLPVKRPALKAVTPTDTEEVDHLPMGARDDFFFFPNLTFPDGMILGRSARILEVYQRMDALARSSAPVLLVGETGVGKEMFARTLHHSGKRSSGPFVAVNCAALPRDLLESELFGIGKRVATSVDERVGKMALADGGTLFLDEVNAFAPGLQPKILRALEEQAVTPVGTTRSLPSDFRLVAATSVEPETLLRTGAMREDLYHRLAALEVRVPPLRERREDLEPLILAFLERICGEEQKRVEGLSRRALVHLRTYPYPGNLRELQNILRTMVILAHPGEVLDLRHLPQKILASPVSGDAQEALHQRLSKGRYNYHELLDEVSERLVRHVLGLTEGNITRAAQMMGLSPFGLRKILKRLKIEIKK
jgi:DNA-binding NtrC family response regulator